MDINFHYFAVKTLAIKAGFPEEEAQIIAEYSQFVDDFNWIQYIPCANIPDYLLDGMNDIVTDTGVVNPVTTGFKDAIDYAYIYTNNGQLFTSSAFHFIPEQKADNYVNIPTVPAKLSAPKKSIITELLNETKERLKVDTKRRKLYLLQLGMYLHIFADTYAHQGFSGYKSYINKCSVTSKTNNLTKKQVNESTLARLLDFARYSILPPIGHAMAGHAPDLTYLSFSMKNYEENIIVRNNTDIFMDAAKEIFEFLLKLSPKTQGITWNQINTQIKSAFIQEYDPDVTSSMISIWEGIFGKEINYNYDEKNIKENFFQKDAQSNSYNYTSEFYWFNLSAEKVLFKLFGKNPREDN